MISIDWPRLNITLRIGKRGMQKGEGSFCARLLQPPLSASEILTPSTQNALVTASAGHACAKEVAGPACAKAVRGAHLRNQLRGMPVAGVCESSCGTCPSSVVRIGESSCGTSLLCALATAVGRDMPVAVAVLLVVHVGESSCGPALAKAIAERACGARW